MNEERQNKNTKKGSGLNTILHLLAHVFLVAAAVIAAIVVMGAFVMLDTKDGSKLYRIETEGAGTAYEESELFNELLGNCVTDVICYGTIRAQMETDGEYNPSKAIDVTAFANRHRGLEEEYITASYTLEDLLKWEANGFEFEEVYMTGEEVDSFLSRMRSVTIVDFEEGNLSGTVSYLNSDAESFVRVEDVSGNLFDEGETLREDTNATVLKNRYLSIEGKKLEEHAFSWDEYYELCDNLQTAAGDLYDNYEEYQKYEEYYNEANSNLIYYIIRTIGDNTEVYSNVSFNKNKVSMLDDELKEVCGKYIIYDPENMIYETNTKVEEETLRYILNGYSYAYPKDTVIMIGIKDDYAVKDAFWQAKNGYEKHSPYFWQNLIAAVICGLFYVLMVAVLTVREGKVRRKRDGEVVVSLKAEDSIPTELMLILAIIVFAGLIFGLSLLLYSYTVKKFMLAGTLPVFAGIYALILSLAFSFFYYSFVRRIKTGTLWKDSLVKKLLDKARTCGFYLYDNASVVLRVWVPFAVFVLLHIVLCFVMFTAGKKSLTVLALMVLVVLDAIVGVLLYRTAQDRQRILEGIQLINDGDMEHKIDENNLHGDNLVLAQAVNNIGEGIRNAVVTSMKDERMKADLITNVSHDIKTPLTSIINYVDLIKRENVDNPKVKEYIEVLDTKSQRLKQLTDDLVEASKISSGNIVLQWEKINLVELLNQTIGEFSEKFEEKMLTPVFRSVKNSMPIEADSRRIWRVIENLFNNVFKYALTGTRVYIDLREKEEEGKRLVMLSVMNISANPIKVNTEELTERFIRGDESRTTEGSGLGLSIAKNLTEVQKGKFDIAVDGDLFKVILTFPLLEQK